MREQVVNLALKLVGCPYIWGGGNPWTGLDCSGFIIWIYQVFGLLPSGDWTAQGLYDHFRREKGGEQGATVPGDLFFYGKSEKEINHVMLVLADGLVVGASGGGHTTTTVEEARRKGAQVKVKPTSYRGDYAGSVHVTMLDE